MIIGEEFTYRDGPLLKIYDSHDLIVDESSVNLEDISFHVAGRDQGLYYSNIEEDKMVQLFDYG